MVEILEKYKFDEDEELRRANDTCARTQQRIAAISREEDEVRDIAKAARTLQASTQQIAAKVARRNVDKNTTKLHEVGYTELTGVNGDRGPPSGAPCRSPFLL